VILVTNVNVEQLWQGVQLGPCLTPAWMLFFAKVSTQIFEYCVNWMSFLAYPYIC